MTTFRANRPHPESPALFADPAIPVGDPIASVIRCPHCGHALTVPTSAVRAFHGCESEPTDTPIPPSPAPPPPTTTHHIPPAMGVLRRTIDRVVRAALGDRAWQWLQTIALVVVVVGVIGMSVGTVFQPREATPAAAPSAPVSAATPAVATVVPVDPEMATPSSAWSAEEQAVIAVLIGYNAAETEAGATLDAAPLMPYLDPDGPLAARRITSLADRRTRNASHVTMLQRWGIGAITVNGDTATVTTQETWSNQEHGETSPRLATVRVEYTLRRTAPHGWRITDVTQHLLTVAP